MERKVYLVGFGDAYIDHRKEFNWLDAVDFFRTWVQRKKTFWLCQIIWVRKGSANPCCMLRVCTLP